MLARALVLGGVATAGWIAVMGVWGERNFYPPLGLFALGLLVAVLALHRERLGTWLRPDWRTVFAGTLLGAASAALTHVGYAVLLRYWPTLRLEVEPLYHTVWLGPGPIVALPVVVLVVVVEELVWRGALLDAAMSSRGAGVTRALPLVGISLSYAVAQAGSGSWALVLVAFALGLFWGLLRLWDGSLVSASIAHLIWSLTVLVFLPLEGAPG